MTTNIIFGITNQSQCKKCKRILFIINIDITNTEGENFVSIKINTHNYKQITNYMNNVDKNSNPLDAYQFIKEFI